MKLIIPFHKISQKDRLRVGGKAYALAVMSKTGFSIPKGICVTTEAYHAYVESTGLRNRIVMELYRKPFGEMRWEEIWDAALRIRNLFLNSPMPPDLYESLMHTITSFFSDQPVSVRSSAPGEDSAQTSFAGLHESYVNLLGTEFILEHIRLVWASLWSDRAILYRQELGLDVEHSAMAVIVQKMVFGEKSGVVFGMNPMDKDQAVVEAVYGLNQGLVDGSIAPDRWIIDRATGQITSHHPAQREKILSRGEKGVRIELLPPDLRQRPPLEAGEVSDVFDLTLKAESLFKSPQDMEWTYTKGKLHTLQARPITTQSGSETDERPWYLSLHRSFDNLKGLRLKIEDEIIPAMEAEAAKLDLLDLSILSDTKLADEIERREHIYIKWQKIYKQDCIPFAHGMRLFARVYNDIMKPGDPFEFMALLRGRDMASVKRNRILLDLADRIRKTPRLADCLKENRIADCDKGFRQQFDELLDQFGDLAWGDTQFGNDVQQLCTLLLEMASQSNHKKTHEINDAKDLENKFLVQFDDAHKAYALELIDLARASYRLRDDDNIYIGKIQGQVLSAIAEARKRIEDRHGEKTSVDRLAKVVKNRDAKPDKTSLKNKIPLKKDGHLKARQIVGQPAGPGVSIGRARVIHGASDLFGFKEGEILVCDAIDPGMTFVVPLAAGIVERRGGMLIHGAIIAREYGIPCVTGAPDVADWIETGDTVTVDGYLGIVIVGEKGSATVGVSTTDVLG